MPSSPSSCDAAAARRTNKPSFFEVVDAARADDLPAFRQLLHEYFPDIDDDKTLMRACVEEDRGAGCALHFACDTAARRVVGYILDHAPQSAVNQKARRGGETPLHRVARMCHVGRKCGDDDDEDDVVTTKYPYLSLYQELLRRGADPDTLDDQKRRPVDVVVNKGFGWSMGDVRRRVEQLQEEGKVEKK
mmetsp:Transcript_12740/g.28933  ORF Transcript_12740/g.28933 Transcript_12740/m.28933 type:complete len:190 (-) Transcript_12740:1077-1646(-)